MTWRPSVNWLDGRGSPLRRCATTSDEVCWRPDARQSGQRRYRTETLRLLIFIGMLQDAGLSLDDIDGILNAATVEEWKAIAQRRLAALDEEIERLERARSYLQGAMLCRFDHPLSDCAIMGAEIDRRLEERP